MILAVSPPLNSPSCSTFQSWDSSLPGTGAVLCCPLVAHPNIPRLSSADNQASYLSSSCTWTRPLVFVNQTTHTAPSTKDTVCVCGCVLVCVCVSVCVCVCVCVSYECSTIFSLLCLYSSPSSLSFLCVFSISHVFSDICLFKPVPSLCLSFWFCL